MPLFSRRQKQLEPPMIHSDVEVVGLTRIDTISTVDSLATIDNQPGAGRTVGLLLTYLGSELENTLNKRAERLRSGSNAPASALVRTNTISSTHTDAISSIYTDATADDQPGAGRTIGRLLHAFGSNLENAMNKRAGGAGLGPKAIADEICRISRHREIWVEGQLGKRVCLPVAPGRRFNKSEAKVLRTLCKKLIEHTRSHIIGNQLIALEEIINLSMKDPRIRAILVYCDLNRVLPCYDEPELLSSTVKALGAVEFSNVHRVWAPVITLFTTPWREFNGEYDLPEGTEEALLATLRYFSAQLHNNDSAYYLDYPLVSRDPSTSFLSARYFLRVIGNLNPRMAVHTFLEKVGHVYTIVASQNPGCTEWSTFEWCTEFSLGSFSRATIPNSHIFNMAANLDHEVFIHHLSFSLVGGFPVSERSNFGIESFKEILPSFSTFDGNIPILYNLISNFTNSSDYWMHLSCMEHLSDEARSSLKGSIFVNKNIYTYCVLVCHTIEKHQNMTRLTEGNALTDMCTPLISFVKPDRSEEHSLATTLAVKFCTINRYCKLMVLRAANKLSTEVYLAISLNLTSTNIASVVASSRGMYWHSRTPQALFRVSCLNSKGFFIFESSPRIRNGTVCVDKMILEGNVAEFISVDGDEKPFCAEGHYPISAFLSNGEPSTQHYIARVGYRTKMSGSLAGASAYTHAEDGASFVTYRREVYDDFDRLVRITEERTSKFEVLVLRYDPIDYQSSLTQEELMDPTGPVGWKNIYTRMEVSLADYLDWFP